jgi:hydroxymethylglutaryl-CoA lyase
MKLPKKVEITEVGPRDGLQNEAKFIPTEVKIALINALNKTGIKRVETTSFVHPQYVPQMRDAKEVIAGIEQDSSIRYIALIPNEKGYKRALESNVKAFSFVVGASDTFNVNNVKMSRENSIHILDSVIEKAKEKNSFIRYCIATSFWCPFEGKVDPNIVLEMAQRADALGVDEIVICDTIGRANPSQVFDLFDKAASLQMNAVISAHFHDTYGLALANVMAALKAGITRFDTSIGGLGGCPFAPGAAGNVATEDVVFMLHEMGIDTGIDLAALVSCVKQIRPFTNREFTGHVHKVKALQTTKTS